MWARVFKDLYPRFQTMRGHAVPRQAGWDSHGLPVEIEVEKELGLSSKQDIEAYGVAAFNERCRESVSRYVEDWIALTERSGIWFDTEHAYWTMSNDFIESVWWLVRQLGRRPALRRPPGHALLPPAAAPPSRHTSSASRARTDVVDPSVFVRFPVVDRDVDLLVWTTTPWTLVSNGPSPSAPTSATCASPRRTAGEIWCRPRTPRSDAGRCRADRDMDRA